jgi:hypothetical protein
MQNTKHNTSGASKWGRRPRTQVRKSDSSSAAVQGGIPVTINPLAEFVLDRKFPELTCYFDTTDTFVAALAPGSSGPSSVIFAAPTPDSYPGTMIVPFCLNATLQGVVNSAGIQQMFRQYQFRGVYLKMDYLCNTQATNDTLPEALVAVDPSTDSPPLDVPTVEAYTNVKRTVMTPQRSFTMNANLFPQINAGTVAAGGIAIPNSTRQFWYDTETPTQQFTGPLGVIRNFGLGGVGSNGAAVRISITVRIALRVPY